MARTHHYIVAVARGAGSAVSETGNDATAPGQRLGPAARGWRIAALAAGVVLIVHGSLFGNDKEWPFAPMSQFAFRVGHNDAIHSTFLQARTPAGEVVRVSLSPASVGIARAEVEGQLPNFQRDPARLSAIARDYQRLHPGVPAMAEWYLCDQVTELRDGRAAGEHVSVLVSWRPDGGPSEPLPDAILAPAPDGAQR